MATAQQPNTNQTCPNKSLAAVLPAQPHAQPHAQPQTRPRDWLLDVLYGKDAGPQVAPIPGSIPVSFKIGMAISQKLIVRLTTVSRQRRGQWMAYNRETRRPEFRAVASADPQKNEDFEWELPPYNTLTDAVRVVSKTASLMKRDNCMSYVGNVFAALVSPANDKDQRFNISPACPCTGKPNENLDAFVLKLERFGTTVNIFNQAVHTEQYLSSFSSEDARTDVTLFNYDTHFTPAFGDDGRWVMELVPTVSPDMPLIPVPDRLVLPPTMGRIINPQSNRSWCAATSSTSPYFNKVLGVDGTCVEPDREYQRLQCAALDASWRSNANEAQQRCTFVQPQTPLQPQTAPCAVGNSATFAEAYDVSQLCNRDASFRSRLASGTFTLKTFARRLPITIQTRTVVSSSQPPPLEYGLNRYATVIVSLTYDAEKHTIRVNDPLQPGFLQAFGLTSRSPGIVFGVRGSSSTDETGWEVYQVSVEPPTLQIVWNGGRRYEGEGLRVSYREDPTLGGYINNLSLDPNLTSQFVFDLVV